MPWNEALTKRLRPAPQRLRRWLAVLALLAGAAGVAFPQSDSKQITTYTAQTGYSLPVVAHNGVDYVGLVGLLEPLGEVSAKEDRKHWILHFAHAPELQFPFDRPRVKLGRQEVDLGGPVLVENGRGMVPLQSLPALLGFLLPQRPVEFRYASRRLFLDKAEVHYAAELKTAGGAQQLMLSFTAPVNPFVASEPGRTRLVFRREPLRAARPTESLALNGKVIASVAYSEGNGTAELTVMTSAPLIASISGDRKAITLTPAAQTTAPAASPSPASAAAAAAGTSATAAKTSEPAAKPSPPAPKFLVMIDAAHGGDDRGAAITDRLAERDFAMGFARRLQKSLENLGVAVRLLRDGDGALSLDQRAVQANAANPSLVILLHASGTISGVRVYSSRLTPETHKSGFVRWETAQAGFVNQSREVAAAISTELLKHDVAASALRVNVSPMNWIAAPAIAIEIGPAAAEKADSLGAAHYQQTLSGAIAAAVAANRGRLPHGEAAR
jgi:N-acetylmuramoyl-L-alanine amidase